MPKLLNFTDEDISEMRYFKYIYSFYGETGGKDWLLTMTPQGGADNWYVSFQFGHCSLSSYAFTQDNFEMMGQCLAFSGTFEVFAFRGHTDDGGETYSGQYWADGKI